MKKIFIIEKYFRKFAPIYILARYVFVKFFLGFYFESEADGFKFLKKKNKLTIVDIGANDGLSTNFFLKNFYNSKIIVFEPIRNIVKLRYKNCNQNKLKIINHALGQKKKNGFLFIPYTYFLFFKLYLSAYSKISYKKNHFIPNENLKSFFKKNFFYKILNVKISKLDQFHIDADIIKIDVEGFEHSVVRGALKTIKKNRPILYIENPSGHIIKLFRKMNYGQYYFNSKIKKFIIFNKNIKNRNFYFFHKKNINCFV